ncbi:MAG: hypothetical protein C0617_13720 [Desulfuromonas sp.]|uniref:chemotaxis protein CheW n=1 Tax=Desulfuromonas sp. TaxID=892 RepID=UPI000CC7295F|nr:chemotaxis protein CheW [Desulfuromonas sp.]PLX82576.1 MAG: hypothetical protein C0617_13720 [Desulfuromonas sp.]
MDLAEIRKKAKQAPDKARDVGGPPPVKSAPVRNASSIQGAPQVGDEPEFFSMGTVEPDEPDGVDPLEALFAWRPELDLATEESYLQGLIDHRREETRDLRQWLAFTLGAEEYAVDIEHVGEIIKPREITDIPRAPEFILGIISLRGIITPVFDLKKRLNLGVGELTPMSRIVICQQGDRHVGLLVDRISHVVRLHSAQIEPPPGVLSGLDRDMVEGVGRDQERMMILLHLPSVLDAELC